MPGHRGARANVQQVSDLALGQTGVLSEETRGDSPQSWVAAPFPGFPHIHVHHFCKDFQEKTRPPRLRDATEGLIFGTEALFELLVVQTFPIRIVAEEGSLRGPLRSLSSPRPTGGADHTAVHVVDGSGKHDAQGPYQAARMGYGTTGVKY